MPIQQATRAVGRADLGEALHEYNPEGSYIANQVFPTRGVPKKASTLSVITRENKKLAETKHSNGAAYNRVSLISEDLSYKCEDYGLEAQLTDDDRANYASDYDAEEETVQLLYDKILAAREIRAKNLAFNTTLFTGSDLFTDNSGSPWDNIATKILDQIAAAIEKVRRNTGVKPDSLTIGAASLLNMKKNTEIKDLFSGVKVVTPQMIVQELPAILDLKNVFVGGDIYDSAAEGQSFSSSDIWPDDYALVFKQHNGHLKSPGLGRTLLWEELSPGEINVTEYREEQTKSDVYRVDNYMVEKMFDPYFGHLIQIDA